MFCGKVKIKKQLFSARVERMDRHVLYLWYRYTISKSIYDIEPPVSLISIFLHRYAHLWFLQLKQYEPKVDPREDCLARRDSYAFITSKIPFEKWQMRALKKLMSEYENFCTGLAPCTFSRCAPMHFPRALSFFIDAAESFAVSSVISLAGLS